MQIESPYNNYTPHFKQLPKHILNVDNRLMRGRAVFNPITIWELKKNGINQVIDLRNSAFVQSSIEHLFCRLFKINYKNYKYPHRMQELPNEDFFQRINNDIISNKGKTYIHCQHDKRRTGISVAIYEKDYTNKSKKEILANLINIGYQELKTTIETPKIKKLRNIYNNFIQRYYPENTINNSKIA